MLFNSYGFIFLFLPITFFVFFAVGSRRHIYGAAWLALASLFFYGWWNPKYVALLLGSIVFNYGIGLSLARQPQPSWMPGRKAVLTIGIAGNLLALSYYKYANFFLDTLNALTGSSWSFGSVLLPLGISFFTFTQIAFLVDTYQGKVKEYNFTHYALFVTYFPHLIAGPVLHHSEMMPQFGNPRTYRRNYDDIAVGLAFFAIGLFKKAALADGVAPYANAGFAAAATGEPLSFFSAWGGALAYTFQLYFDFSGYSDMAVGLSRLFGIKLPLNFNSPYKSTNIIDFWRRWHMTLSRFLRDYLYLPLGGNRKGRARRYVNLMVTMLLGGLWHGAGWTFVIWGGLHGCYLIVNHAWLAFRDKTGFPRGRGSWFTRFTARLLTFVAVVVGWVFFRSPTLDGALTMLAGMAGMNGVSLPSGLVSQFGFLRTLAEHLNIGYSPGGGTEFVLSYVWIISLSAIAFILPNTQEFLGEQDLRSGSSVVSEGARPAVARIGRFPGWRPTIRWAIAMGALLGAGVLTLSSVTEFLYFQF